MIRSILLHSALAIALSCSSFLAFSQVNEDQVGAWYMYFYDKEFKSNQFGVQGDVQFRNFDYGADLEQLLIRSGLTFRPKNMKAKLTAGLGHITSGTPGESSDTSTEIRIYQEALLPHKLSERLSLKHRFRYEQRFVDGQDFRTRYRYNLFMTVLLNQPEGSKGRMYISAYNELFVNGQKSIGDGRYVEYFDRNRLYLAFGYGISEKLKVQAGVMRQTLNSIRKDQVQLSLHHTF
jgi:hypothetical protein